MSAWIKDLKKWMKLISNLKPKDRLEKVSGIIKCNRAVADSVAGWANWLIRPELMNEFTEEELAEILNEFREIAISFLKFDLKWTKYLSQKKKAKANLLRNKYKYVT